jgi:hypothetical protein
VAAPTLRFPLSRHYISDARCFVYRLTVRLEVQSGQQEFVPLPFRLDSGSDFMTIPQWMARQNKIAFSEEAGLFPKTAAGRADKPSFISPVWFSFPQLPAWKFATDCVFTPYNLPYCLFALNDFVPQFLIRSSKETPDYPEGSVLFQLRGDHSGKRR